MKENSIFLSSDIIINESSNIISYYTDLLSLNDLNNILNIENYIENKIDISLLDKDKEIYIPCENKFLVY